jgi:hypothetical protein
LHLPLHDSLAQGSRAVYTTHSSVGYLPRDVVSLRVRHEQLTRQDFHLLDCGLAGRSPFPALSPRIFPRLPGPLPRRSPWCNHSFLPTGHRPFPSPKWVGTPQISRTTTSVRRLFTRLQSFANVQASGFARHPGRSHRRACYYNHTPGGRDFYVHAYLGLLPPRAVDMLAVRIEQLTAEGLSPPKTRGLAGRS